MNPKLGRGGWKTLRVAIQDWGRTTRLLVIFLVVTLTIAVILRLS
jgi:hypothetical protein